MAMVVGRRSVVLSHLNLSVFTGLVLMPIALSSCISDGQDSIQNLSQTSPDPHQAAIYLYRPPDGAPYVRVMVSVDRQEVIELPVSGYYIHTTNPGKLEIEGRIRIWLCPWPDCLPANLTAEGGHSYFLRVAVPPLLLSGKKKVTLIEMPKELAESELSRCCTLVH